MLYRPLKYLFVFLLGLLIVPVMVLPPEGAFRDGAFSISFLLWFLLLPLAVFLLAQIAGNPSLACKRADSSLPVFAVGGRNKFCIADAAVLAFLCWIIFSLIAMLARDGGNLRYAINSVSLYFFMVYVYFLIRVSRAILSPVLLLALFAAICVMCLTESFSGLYAYLIRDPAFRQSWLENSEELLRNSGMFYPEGSPERILLENRILGSSEPLGTYGLANTLAGVLLPVLVALAGLVCIAIGSTLRYRKSEAAARSTSDGNPTHCPEQPRKSLVSFFVLAFVVFAPLFCVLILTKSRTGILAFLFGCFLFVLGLILRHRFVDRSVSVPVSSGESTMAEATAESGGPQGTKSRKVSSLFVFGLVVVLLVGISIFLAFRRNIIDREVFTEAGKSLGYRLDYWRSSAAMIADYPWFGIGPGSFQTRYPSYMMPLASEVIADPHNFVFELGALFGLPALLLFLLFFVLGCPIPFLSRLNQNGWFVATGVPDRVQAPVVEDSSQKTSSRKKGRVKSQQPKLISDAGTS
ncbi:MAG: O-antigen ligase family protein, partial [Thermoguttaceae bacterium]|nr:O-antigen ligase family protein [Thermoguttaceae bacterium]